MATARFVDLAWVLLLVTPAIPTAAQQKKLTVTDQVVFGAYWTAEPGWHTEFQLRNNLLSGPLTVTPVLRLSNGQEYPLSPVTIPVSDLATVDVSQELANLASPLAEQAGTYGSVVFKRSGFYPQLADLCYQRREETYRRGPDLPLQSRPERI